MAAARQRPRPGDFYGRDHPLRSHRVGQQCQHMLVDLLGTWQPFEARTEGSSGLGGTQPLRGEQDGFDSETRRKGFFEQPDAFDETQALSAAVLALMQRAQQLDTRVGGRGDQEIGAWNLELCLGFWGRRLNSEFQSLTPSPRQPSP